MGRNADKKNPCADCGRLGKKGAIDPDGAWRCWWHAASTAAERKARADKQRRNRATVERARAAGVLPPEPEIEGRGQRPYADALRQVADSGAVWDVEINASTRPAAAPANAVDLLEGLSLAKPADRVAALHRVIDRMAVGELTRTMGAGIIQAIKASAKEVEAGATDRGVVVHFREISSIAEKEAFLRGDYGPTDASTLMDD